MGIKVKDENEFDRFDVIIQSLDINKMHLMFEFGLCTCIPGLKKNVLSADSK